MRYTYREVKLGRMAPHKGEVERQDGCWDALMRLCVAHIGKSKKQLAKFEKK